MKNIRWTIAGLLFLSSVINYIDRQVLSVLAPTITKELDITAMEYGLVVNAFLVPYTIMYIGSGLLVDRWGTRVALAAFLVWWSAASISHSLAQGFVGLALCRFLLGLGEPGNFMAGFRAISEWYPAKERAFVNGLLNAGASVGAIIAPPLVGLLGLRFGWRAAFVITGLLGFVWLAAWLRTYYLPHAHPRITAEELALVPTPEPPAPRQPILGQWLTALRDRQVWALLLPRFVSDPVWWFYLFWLPKYLSDQHHFDLAAIAVFTWMPYLAADLGALFGGYVSGRLIRNGWPILRARGMGMLPFALVMPVSVLVPSVSVSVALGIICLVSFAHMAWKTNLQTISNDLFPASRIGSITGIIAFGSGLGGTLFTGLTGFVVQNFSYDAIFILMGFLHPIAYAIIWLLLLRKRALPQAV